MKLNNREVLAVVVPDDAVDFSFRRHNQIVYLLKDTENPFTGWQKSEVTVIPNTTWMEFKQEDWQLLGRASEITEEQARELVEKYNIMEKYKDYKTQPDSDLCAMFLPTVDTALESFQSWCIVHNITNQVLLIQKSEP